MARLCRMVLPGIPHHVTQRGNRREKTFFEPGDYALYLDLLASAFTQHGVEIWICQLRGYRTCHRNSNDQLILIPKGR
jgi:REP element-mobilizing transposase RayT